VVIDDRHDFYGEDFLRIYLTAIHLEPGWEVFLRRSDCLLLPKRSALTAILRKTPEWKTLYSDDVAMVWVRFREREDSDSAPSR